MRLFIAAEKALTEFDKIVRDAPCSIHPDFLKAREDLREAIDEYLSAEAAKPLTPLSHIPKWWWMRARKGAK